ncbi:MAG: hypothetical protein HQ578_06065 [Chloroflexi bacterium]|nr:hypothetical protein [Chloroflexota bacterium]
MTDFCVGQVPDLTRVANIAAARDDPRMLIAPFALLCCPTSGMVTSAR